MGIKRMCRNTHVASSGKKFVNNGRILLLLGVPLLFICGSALGQHMNAEDSPCQGPGSNADKAQCYASAQVATDRKLNLTYKAILTKLGPSERDALIAAERLWVQFRDANCHAERVLYEGGSGAPIAFVACMEAGTRQRTNDLLVMYGWRLEK